MLHRLSVVVLAVLLVSLALPMQLAQAFDPGDVPADAKWYVHVDVAQLVDSLLGQRLLERRDMEPGSQGVARVEHWAGFNPLTDVEELLIFHNGFLEPEAVVVLRGTFTPQRIIARAQLAAEYEAVELADHEAHRFRLRMHGQERGVYAIFEESWLALSSDRASLAEAVEVLTGEEEGLEEGASLLAPRVEGAWFQAGTLSLERLHEHHPGLAESIEALHVVLAERDDQVEWRMHLTAASEAEARQMTDVLQGLRAIVQLQHEPEAPLRRLLDALTIERQGGQVRVNWTHSIEHALQALDRLRDQWGQWGGRR